ncbi:MAG: pilus assembly protein [Siculibacillus sp.]
MLRRLLGDRSGATAMTFALVLLPLIVAAGGGVDAYVMWKKQGLLQSVVDAAVLAGSVQQDESADGVATATTFISKNFDDPQGATSTKTITLDIAKSLITAEVTAKVKASFLPLIGLSEFTIRVKSAATWGGQLMEVAISLDGTGSMSGSKLTAAKQAAKDLTNILFTVPGTGAHNSKVKVALVPFARYVNVGLASRPSTWLDVPSDSTWTKYECWDTWPGSTCTGYVHRTGTCYNDGVPYSCEWDECTGWTSVPKVTACATNSYSSVWHGCVGSRASPLDLQAEVTIAAKVPGLMDAWCNAELVRLTNTKGKIISGIEAIGANDETFIATGMLWAWRTLSSKLPFGDGAADAKTTKKAIVLMTDGANTVSATPPQHWGSDVAASNAQLTQTCANAKAEGISIFTVAFEVTDANIKSILTNCASNANYFFDATDSAALIAAFNKIGSMLTARRLVY